MRPTTLLVALCALGASAQSASGPVINTSGIAALRSSLEANPAGATSLVNHLTSAGAAALKTLSAMAATATGAEGSILRSEYSQAKSLFDGAQSTLQSLGYTTTDGSNNGNGGSAPTSASAAASSSSGLAVATGVPVMAGAIGFGMAALAML